MILVAVLARNLSHAALGSTARPPASVVPALGLGAVVVAFGVFVAQLVDQGLDLVVVQAGIDVRQAHRDAHSGGGSADHAAALSRCSGWTEPTLGGVAN